MYYDETPFFCASNGNTSSHMESKISQLQMLLNRSLTICRYWTPRHFPTKLLSRHCEIMIRCKATSHYLNPVKWYIYTTTCKSCWYCHYSWGTTLMFPHAETMGHGHPCVKYIKNMFVHWSESICVLLSGRVHRSHRYDAFLEKLLVLAFVGSMVRMSSGETVLLEWSLS